jgi:hypothetical protein
VRLSVGVAISVGIHTMVAGWLTLVAWLWPAERPVAEPPKNVEVEIIDVTPPPIAVPTEVAIIHDIAPEVAPIAPRAQQRIATTTRVPVETAAASSAPPATIPTPIEQGPHSRMFDMRAPKPRDVRLDITTIRDDLVNVPKGTNATVDVKPTGQLAPSGGGTYRSNQGVFNARVGRDGSVKLQDGRNLHAELGAATNTGDEEVALNNHRASDSDTKPDSGKTVPIMGGSFDISDALMRGHGQDPYASRKLKFLDSTRDERVAIGNRYREQQLAQSTQLMQKNLDRLFAMRLDRARLKAALFELWDDCAETGEPAMIEGGKRARKLVVGTIRGKLPANTETAYTADELAAFNRRKHSKAVFAPYED